MCVLVSGLWVCVWPAAVIAHAAADKLVTAAKASSLGVFICVSLVQAWLLALNLSTSLVVQIAMLLVSMAE
jgi:hypothetical protein